MEPVGEFGGNCRGAWCRGGGGRVGCGMVCSAVKYGMNKKMRKIGGN